MVSASFKSAVAHRGCASRKGPLHAIVRFDFVLYRKKGASIADFRTRRCLSAGRDVNQDLAAAALTQRFEEAFPAFIEAYGAKLKARLAPHRERADALLRLVRQAAADLMDIAESFPRSEDAFEVKRKPYWVAADAKVTLIALSAGAIASLMPKAMRERRRYRNLAADADQGILHNISNLEWAVKRNIEDAFFHFGGALSKELDKALTMTREAFQLALERRSSRSESIGFYVEQAEKSLAVLRKILAELQDLEPHSAEALG